MTSNYLFPIKYKKENEEILEKIDAHIDNVKNWNYERVDPPYIYELGNANKIHYFGTPHVMNINEPIVEILKNDFHRFSKNSEGVVVLLEDWEVVEFENLEEACDKKGERGLIMHWSKDLGVRVVPTDFNHPKCEHLKLLSENANYDDIVLFVFLYFVKARKAHKWHEEKNLGQYIIDKVNSSLECADLPITTFEHLEKLHVDRFGQNIEQRSGIKAWEDLDINKPDNDVNSLFKKYHMLRDRNFLYQIVANYKNGKNVYCLYGCDHAQFHEPVLKALVG